MKTLTVSSIVHRGAKSSKRIVSITTGRFGATERLTRTGKTLAEVMTYANPDVVARIAKEEKMPPEEAESIFKDVLLFLWLGHNVKGALAPTPRIDVGWHVFLLFTKDYRDFCAEHFGGFIDHHPRRLADRPDGGRMIAKSRRDVQTVLVNELDLSLSRNWLYSRLELVVGDGCVENEAVKASAKCCGNCGSDCCKR